MPYSTCSVVDCGRNIHADAMCLMHLRRVQKNGSVAPRERSVRGCAIEGCEAKHHIRGWCKMHHTRWLRHGDPEFRKYGSGKRGDGEKPCAVTGCGKASGGARGMCPMHYQRWRKTGSALTEPPTPPMVCSVPQCGKKRYQTVYCSAHYTRQIRYGSPVARTRGEIVDGRKVCSQCLADLPVDQFRGSRGECRICTKKYVHARRALLASVASDGYATRAVFDRDSWECQLCGLPIDVSLRWPHRFSPSVDHIVPISKGGTDTFANVQSAHLTCNISKGVQMPA